MFVDLFLSRHDFCLGTCLHIHMHLLHRHHVWVHHQSEEMCKISIPRAVVLMVCGSLLAKSLQLEILNKTNLWIETWAKKSAIAQYNSWGSWEFRQSLGELVQWCGAERTRLVYEDAKLRLFQGLLGQSQLWSIMTKNCSLMDLWLPLKNGFLVFVQFL